MRGFMETLYTAQSRGLIHYLNPWELLKNLWRNRDLIGQFTLREIQGRYRGSFLGILWSFINPLVMLLTYTFVFGTIFKSRWPGIRRGSLSEFAIILFSGMIAFNIFQECVGRAAGLVVAAPNFVKKVVFPLEILPLAVMGSALFHAGVSLAILLLAAVLEGNPLSWTLLLAPLVLVNLVFLTLGLTWFIAGIGVFLRDMNYTILLLIQVLFFVTPILYPLEIIPAPIRRIVSLNPLTGIIENFRSVLLWGRLPAWYDLGRWLLPSILVMLLGYAWFMTTKRAFGDVI